MTLTCVDCGADHSLLLPLSGYKHLLEHREQLFLCSQCVCTLVVADQRVSRHPEGAGDG